MLATLLSIVGLIVTPTLAYNPPPATMLPSLPIFGPQIHIELPPRLIMTPAKLEFPKTGEIYDFDANSGTFKPAQGRPPDQNYKVTATLNGSGDGAYYIITIKGFRADELPKATRSFRLTFKSVVPKVNIEKVETYLKPNPNSKPTTARLSGSNFTFDANQSSHICLDTKTTVRGSIRNSVEAHLFQTIPLHGIFVPGNVAAGGKIEGFSLDANSIAVGGKIIVDGGTQLKDYLDGQTVSFGWNKVEGQVLDMFARGAAIGSTINSPTYFRSNHYTASAWNLNAPAKDPVVSTATSFSSPPEGKVWYHNKSLFLDAKTKFIGSGTVVINGNLEINNEITCEDGKIRLAFLVNGNIKINSNAIGCGAYIAANGGIEFSDSSSGNLKGIFVAKASVSLPNPTQITGTYLIGYDSYLASHPTALIGELLKLAFAPS